MKREFLEGLDLGEGVKIPKAAIEAIMAEHGKTKGVLENTIATLTTERDGFKTQLDTAAATIKSYEGMDVEGIKTKATEWETKYNTDTQKLKDDLAATQYTHAVETALGEAKVKFTSDSARKTFISDLTNKKLPVQDGKLLGMDDFIKTYQTSDPGAFAPADNTLVPHVVTDTKSGPAPSGPAFGFSFTGVRAHNTETKKE